MKKLLVLSLIGMSSLSSKSQATFHAEVGTSTAASVIVGMGFGYQKQGVLIESMLVAPPFDRSIEHGVYAGANAGYEIKAGHWSFSPIGGAAYRLQSTDKKHLNGVVGCAGIRIGFQDVKITVTGMDKNVFATIGIKDFLRKDY